MTNLLAPPAGGRSAWRRLRTAAPTGVGLGLLVLSLWVLGDVLAQFQLDELVSELRSIGLGALGWSVAFTALAFTALAGYEYFALRFAGRRLRLRHVTLGAFVAQSIAHTTGFAAVVATSLRYRMYAPLGLDLMDVAKVQAFFVFTFCLGLATLSGVVIVLEPQLPAYLVPLPLWLWRLIALSALAAVLSYLLWSARTHHPLRILGQTILPPRPGVTFVQITLGFIDLGAGAAALWVLLPPGFEVGYLALLGMFLAAIILGAVSHVPGGLGVFEGAMLLQLGPAPEQTAAVVGALLAYRAVFYLLPFMLGCLLYGVHELDRLMAAIRGARKRGLARLVPSAAAGFAFVLLVAWLF
jgi:uncharacterized membrane protein YbhN (UPF0104 family)